MHSLANALNDLKIPSKNWRDNSTTQTQVMSHALFRELFANAVLIVGQDKVRIPVIKEILQTLSPQLEQRLSTPTSNDRVSRDLVTYDFSEMEVESMKQIVKYAYTHEWTWTWSGETKELRSLFSFFHQVDSLGIQTLTQKIQTQIDQLINVADPESRLLVTPQNVCQIFEDANSFQIENVKKFALDMILGSPKLILSNAENHQKLTVQGLVEILQKDDLQVESELELFYIVLNWAKVKLAELKLDSNSENISQILKDILPHLRFTQMTSQQFQDHVVPTDVLDFAQTLKIQKVLQSKSVETLSSRNAIERPRLYKSTISQDQRKFSKMASVESLMSRSNKVDHFVEEFGENQKRALLLKLKKLEPEATFLNLDIKLISDCTNLIAFLEQTSNRNPASFKINLKVDTIKFSSKSFKSSTKFPQISAINFESLEESTQLKCLIKIVQNSPNLRKLSIGNFKWCLYNSEKSFAHLTQFFSSVDLRNVQFSCRLLGSPELTKNLINQLKLNGVSIRKAGFNVWSPTSGHFEIIHLLHEHLEEIHFLNHATPIPMLDCTFFNLKILCVRCDPNILVGILKMAPQLFKLVWHSSGFDCPPLEEEPLLTHLTILTLFLNSEDHVEYTKLFWNCPALKRLTVINWCMASLCHIYPHFQQVTKLRILQQGGLAIENIIGHKDDPRHLVLQLNSRSPYIGNLKELTTLSFGYKNYQHGSLVSNWTLNMRAFINGISHLKKLTKIVLPPIRLEQAMTILTYLAANMRQMKVVEVQVWQGQKEGQDGTMKFVDADKLSEIPQRIFKIEAIPIRPEDSFRWFLY